MVKLIVVFNGVLVEKLVGKQIGVLLCCFLHGYIFSL